MLTLNVGFPRYTAQQRAHVWQQHPWQGLAGKTALVIGLGAIGRRVAAHARHLGMRVLGLRARPGALDAVDEMVDLEGLHDALGRADVVCVHVPLTVATRGLLDVHAFRRMKRGAILINTSRGGVMDEDALREALADGTLAAAYLDVFATEPLPADSALWDTPNLVLTPHISDTVADYQERFADFFADNLDRWLKGQPLANVVDPTRGY
jgi:phosphoglycerate dehydrogenase-like enzyme